MAGHSKWAGIKHKKAIVDARRGKLFTKLARAITAAAKEGGGDPNTNAALGLAVQKAKDASMPKDNIERAIAKGTGADADADAFETILYEGYGPSGVAVIVEALTDNRNRTASEVRSTFSKHGGNLAETGAVSFMFDRVGVVEFDADVASADDMLEAAIEAGADDVQSSQAGHEIYCAGDSLAEVAKALEARFGEPRRTALVWKPQNTISVDDESGEKLLKLIDVLEDNDDVQNVFANFEVSDALVQKMSA